MFLALGILAPAVLAIVLGDTTGERLLIFGGCVLAALLVLNEFIKDG